METTNRLYRSTTDKVIGGVCGGLGDYLNIDPVIVRIAFVLLAVFGGSGVLVYIILWIVIPEQKYFIDIEMNKSGDAKVETGVFVDPVTSNRKKNSSLIAGIALIAFGLLFLADRLIPMYNLWDFWPLLLVVAGVLLIKPELFGSSKNIKS
jgi:phage shock protein PspC (stress-responsive transcriptional regulator)